MKKQFILLLCITLVCVTKTAIATSKTGTPSTLYINVNLIHPDQNLVVPDGFLWVTDNRFNYVGHQRPKTPEYTTIVDLKGAYVTPGFIDTHAHIGLGAVSFSVDGGDVKLHAENQDTVAKWNAEKLLQFGITSIRNPGGDTRANLNYRRAQRSGELSGPRAFVAGHIINTDAFSGLVVSVDSDAALTQAITHQAKQGVDYIKLYTGLNEAQVELAVKQAARYQLPVIGHLENLSWQRGAELGIDNLVHAMPISPDLLPKSQRENYIENLRPGTFAFFEWFKAADLSGIEIQNMLEALQRNGTSVDPTLIVFFNAFYGNQATVTTHEQLNLAHPDLVANWQDFYHFNLGWSDQDFEQAQAIWPKVLDFVKQLYDAEVLLSVGTDLGNPWVIPGVSYVQEMQLLQSANIPTMDVLRFATHDGAHVLGKADQLGQLCAGYLADFIVFAKNPADNLANLDSLAMVIQNGIVVVD